MLIKTLMIARFCQAVFLALALCQLFGAVSRSFANWSWSNPLPQGELLQTAAYGEGILVAGGASSRILRSADGEIWDFSAIPQVESVRSIAYGNGLFIAVGDGAAGHSLGVILVSSNAFTWTPAFEATTRFSSISFARGIFFAVTLRGTSFSSTDGFDWKENRLGSNNLVSNVQFNGEAFFAIEWPATVLTSKDAVTWSLLSQFIHEGARAFVYGQNRFVAVGNGGSGRHNISTSLDGLEWTAILTTNDLNLYGITFGNGLFITVGDQGTILTSQNGTDWVARDAGTDDDLRQIIFGNGRFIAVGNHGSILVSMDGINWAQKRRGSVRELRGVIFGSSGYVAVGKFPLAERGVILRPAASGGWSEVEANDVSPLNSVTLAEGRYVAVGKRGAVFESTNGIRWAGITLTETNNLQSVCFGAARWVAVGDNGRVLVSSDARQWSSRTVGDLSVQLTGVVHGAGKFVAVGFRLDTAGTPYAATFSSADGVAWTPGNWVQPGRLFGVTFGNGLLIAVGPNTVLTSSDGMTWTKAIIPPSQVYLRAIAYGSGRFVAVGAGGILESIDGQNWFKTADLTHDILSGVCHGNGTFVAVGYSGTVLSSSASSVPVLTGPAMVGGNFMFRVIGPPGLPYEIQSKTNLAAGLWSTISQGTFADDSIVFVDTNTTRLAVKYYRISLQR